MKIVRALQATLLSATTCIQFIAADCVGATATYNESGLIVPFENLCGQDITADVDFVDLLKEPSREHCLERCVQKAPMCYGFDYAEDDLQAFNCWLKQSAVNSGQTNASTRVNAAILMPEILGRLSPDCFSLGLHGCFKKNGQLGVVASSTASGSVATTSSAASSAGTGSGLSINAKAGIGAGLGAAAFLVIGAGVFWRLRRRRPNTLHVQRQHDVHAVHELSPTEKHALALDGQELSEMPGQDTGHGRAELESTEVMARRSSEIEVTSVSRSGIQ